MATTQIKAKEMKDATVVRISLVERGANRMPIKVTKSTKDSTMSILDLDIASVFKREKPKAEEPRVVGVAVMKADKPTPGLTAQIEAAGFVASSPVGMGDGSQVFAQGGETDFSGVTVIKNEGSPVVLVAKGFRPYSLDMEVENGATFEEMCAARGFYPGISTMMDVLREVVVSRAQNSENPGAAAKEIATLFAEAGKYAASLVNALPSKAFKLETVDPEDEDGSKGDGESTDDVTNADPAATEAAKKGEGENAAAATETDPAAAGAEGQQDPATGAADPAPTETAAAAPAASETAQKSDAAPAVAAPAVVTLPDSVMKTLEAVGGFAKKMEELTASVSQLSENVTAQDASLKEVADRVDTAEKVAKSASEAVTGVVVTGSAGEAGDRQIAAKQDRPQGREIDTAYSSRPRRR